MKSTLYVMDVLEGLSKIEDNTIDCCVTSPPYYGLRDYGTEGQIGQEDSPEAFISRLVDVFKEVKRVLKKDGTLWVNMGDSYAGSGRGPSRSLSGEHHDLSEIHKPYTSDTIKAKDLIGIPWMLAFALRADGWYLRQDIIWSKPNPMPESVQDRCTKSHEYIFMLSRSPKYYYDNESIKTEAKYPGIPGMDATGFKDAKIYSGKHGQRADKQRGHSRRHAGFNERWDKRSVAEQCSLGANKRSVWEVATRSFTGAHFATFPQELITDCIKAGCPKDGLVLDPFAGAGTTLLVANKLGRNAVGIEISEDYAHNILAPRLRNDLGMFIDLEII